MRVVFALVVLLWALPATAQPLASAQPMDAAQRQAFVRTLREVLVQDPSILREALAALQADELRRQDSVTRDVLTMLGPRLVDPADPVAGNPFGDVTVVEFYDTRCPYCRRMKPVLAKLARDDPKLKIVVKDLPVLGPASQLESRALLAAQKQGGYFKLQDAIMQTGGTSTRDTLRALADQIGLDGGALLREMDDPAIKTRLQSNIELAREIGIQGTPAFVIGAQLIPGAADLIDLQHAVAEARGKH